MKEFTFPGLKDTAVLLGWIAGLLCIGGLCWFLSKPLRTDILRQSINRAWTRTNETRRLDATVGPGVLKPGLMRLGTWYTVTGGDGNGNRALIFTVIADGSFLPCAAIVNRDGKVDEILPLTAGGSKLLNRISPGVLNFYIRRIEGAL